MRTSSRRKRSQPQNQPPTRQQGASALPDVAIWLGLVLSIFIVYSQVTDFDFTSLDDDEYVFKNVHVLAGLTPASVKWAFTAVVSANWAPVTMLSHMLDAQLFHMQSGMHHLVNVVFHALAAMLLFAVLRRATHARWASAFVAFMFALHPLHVGSVAWVSERKDVLSAFFLFLGLYCYLRYTERPTLVRYLPVAASFCIGLMCKSMLVTFPFVLLLFDFWPLRRVKGPGILWEKLPLFAFSAGACVVTYWVQHSTGAVQKFPLATRVENALVSYVTYLWQTIWPTRLAVFYPFSKSLGAWQAVLAAAVILGVSALAILAWRTRPYLAVGWFWYLGTLVPVIGLVQVGGQAHADRYTYIPMIGLSIMLAWGAGDVVKRWPQAKLAVTALAAICCVVWMTLASKETAYWQNSETLYQRALAVTQGNWAVEYELAYYLATAPGRRSDAIAHYEAAVRIRPDYAEAQRNLGLLLVMIPGRQSEALAHFEAAQRLNPHAGLESVIEGLRGVR